MTPERWQRVKSLFERALDQPADARATVLEESDETLSVITEVRKLLADDAGAGSFLEGLNATATLSVSALALDAGNAVSTIENARTWCMKLNPL